MVVVGTAGTAALIRIMRGNLLDEIAPDEGISIGKQIIQSHVDNVWMIGTVRYPAVAIVKNLRCGRRQRSRRP